MKVLVVGRDESFRNLVRLILENSFAAEVYESLSETDALEQRLEGLDCVLYDFEPGVSSEGEIEKFFSEFSRNRIIVCTPDSGEKNELIEKAKLFGRFSKDFVIEPMQTLFSRIATEADQSASIEPEYYKVKISVLRDVGRLTCDAYIRLSDDKFVKTAREGDTFDESDFDRYARKNVDHLFISRADFKLFLQQLSREMSDFSHSRSVKGLGGNELRSAAGTVELIHAANSQFGFSDEMEQVTKASVDLAVNTFRKIPELNDVVSELENIESYFSSHSMMLAFVACGYANAMGWNSDFTRYKLTLAAFLHDLMIKDSELARYQTVFEVALDSGKFTQAQQLEFQEHPTRAAALVRTFAHIPPEVDVIIEQHHERPDGTGFPARTLVADIHPLSACFIMAHDLVSYVTLNGKNWDIGEYLIGAADRFRAGNFKEILKAVTISAARNFRGK